MKGTTKTAFLFPGQGAQHVGMGKDLFEAFDSAREYFDRAEAATGLALKKLCFEGPEEQLSHTDIAQLAIFTVSVATLKCITDTPGYVAGLSLGEYTALYAAGAIDFETGVRLVARRGELMQQAATSVPSGMVSVLGLDEEKANALCQAAAGGQILTCANFNCPGQVVLSGEMDACKRAEEMARDFGATGAVPLKVAGAFHSQIMAPAAEKLGQAIDKIELHDPRPYVVSNVDAEPCTHAGQIKDKLVRQLTSPVRWQQSMEYLLAEGVERFYEIGPGRVLAGLMRRIHRRVNFVSINSRQAVEKLTQD
ncbi:MAG: ACP S-malonyltransferase [Planctomycetota bacterium]|nr:ACP S-malonyltransferase [Planctomycetota bacterium]